MLFTLENRLYYLLITILLSIPQSLSSQEKFTLDPIEVEGKREEKIAEKDPASSSETLKLNELSKQDTEIAGILKKKSGVQVREYSSPGQRKSISIRGATAQQVLVLFEGVPLNTPLGMGTDLSLLPLFPASVAELYRGGKSHIFGSDAIGGALNITIDEKDAETEVRLLHGSFDTTEAGFNLLKRSGGSHLTAGFNLSISEGNFTYIDGNKRQRTASNNSSSILKGLYKYSSPLSENLILSSAGFLTFASREIMGLMEFPSTTAREKDFLTAVGFKGALLDAVASDSLLEGSLFFRGFKFRYRDLSPPMPPFVDTELFTAGIFTSLLFEKYLSSSVLSVYLSSLSDFGLVTRHNSPKQNPKRMTGAFGASYKWLPTERLLIHQAVRLEVSEEAGLFPLPALGISFELLDSLRIFANGTRAFRLPTFDELYFDAGYVKGNRNLKPEDALSIEAGIALELSWLEMDARYFHLLIDNMILFTQKTVYYVQAENSEKALISGVESSLRIKPFKNLSFSAAYTFRNSKSEKTSMKLPLMPPHLFSGRMEVELSRVYLYIEAVGQDRFSLNGFETQFEEERVVFNAGLTLTPIKKFEIAVHLKNINNKMDMLDIFQHPLPGFSAYAMVTARL